MDCHLVPVKVSVKSRTNQRMKLNSLTFYQDRLKCLDSQSVKRRRTVQHHWMLLDHFLQHIPHLGLQALHHLLGALNIMSRTVLHQLLHHKGFKQLNGHLLGQAALIDLKLRPHHDNRTAGIVYPLA